MGLPNQQPTRYLGVDANLPFPPRIVSLLGHATPDGGINGHRIQAFPWPYTEDNAVGYLPLGGVPFPDPSTLAGFDNGIDGTGLEDSSDPESLNQSLSAIPRSLPDGYTENKDKATWYGGEPISDEFADVNTQAELYRFAHFRRNAQLRGWLRGQSVWNMIGNEGVAYLVPALTDETDTNKQFPRLLLPDGGIYDYPWGPFNQGASAVAKTYSGSAPVIGGGGSYVQTVEMGRTFFHPGWRNVRAYVSMHNSTGGSIEDPTFKHCKLVLKRTSGWDVGTPTVTISETELTVVHIETMAGHGQVLQVDVSNVHPPDGQLGVIYAAIYLEQDTGVVSYNITVDSLKVWFSPRVDIPLPWTITGFWRDEQLVIPGGYLAGAITSPDLRVPQALSGTPTDFDARITGDDTSIIVTASLSSGSSYTIETPSFGIFWNFTTCLGPNDETVVLDNFTNTTTFTAPATGLFVFRFTFDPLSPSIPKLNLKIT